MYGNTSILHCITLAINTTICLSNVKVIGTVMAVIDITNGSDLNSKVHMKPQKTKVVLYWSSIS